MEEALPRELGPLCCKGVRVRARALPALLSWAQSPLPVCQLRTQLYSQSRKGSCHLLGLGREGQEACRAKLSWLWCVLVPS